jgi:signal transduction histidine kinase
MSPKDKPKGARHDTDSSLRDERTWTDDELAARRASVEEDSDAVVERARDKADDVLSAARTQADEALGGRGSAHARAAITRERGAEDDVVEEERAVADAQLAVERDERAKALRELLRLERVATDQHLLIERAHADEALLSRDEFMGIVAHDLRTLLGGIALHAAMLVKDSTARGPAETIARRAEGIQRFTARMNRLIGDLVDVASIEAGKFRVVAAVGDAVELVHESVHAFKPSAEAKGLTFEAALGAGSFTAKLDHERALQVVANLVSNAIKFTPSGGRVSLRLDRIDDHVRFSVSDTGPGIDPAKHEAVFIRFWQAQQGDKRGMGLGLYIAKCIVEAHGGTISLESTPGQGSTFSFTIPAA